MLMLSVCCGLFEVILHFDILYIIKKRRKLYNYYTYAGLWPGITHRLQCQDVHRLSGRVDLDIG